MAADDGIIVRIPDTESQPPGAELFVFDPAELDELVTTEVGGSALFAARFRECAARALLLPKYNPGKRSPLWQQRQKASQLLDVARKYPTFPIILETVRECLQDVYDLPALDALAKQLGERTVRIVETTTESASPFARALLFGYVAAFMYEGDSPLAERRAAALSLDAGLLAELLGRAELRELLDPAVIERVEREVQRLAPERRARGSRRRGRPHPDARAPDRRRSGRPSAEGEGDDPGGSGGRARLPHRAGRRETRARQSASPAPNDSSRSRMRAGCVTRSVFRCRSAYPSLSSNRSMTRSVTSSADTRERTVHSRPPMSPLTSGSESPSSTTPCGGSRTIVGSSRASSGPMPSAAEWCDAEILRRLRRLSLAALRHEVEPVEPQTFARFLPDWQHVGGILRGVDAVASVIEQLAGARIPASAWESLILPSRVSDYSPAMLDELTATGEVVWAGGGSLPGNDGWVSLHLAEAAPVTLSAADRLRTGCAPARHPRTRSVAVAGSSSVSCRMRSTANVSRRGHGAAPDLVSLVRLVAVRRVSGSIEPVDDGTLVTAIWDLVWAGLAHQRHPGSVAHADRRFRCPQATQDRSAISAVPRSVDGSVCARHTGRASHRRWTMVGAARHPTRMRPCERTLSPRPCSTATVSSRAGPS